MGVDGLALNHENYVGERRIVYDLPHVQNERVDRLVVDFVLFQLPDIQDADVIEPLTSIKTAEYEELFHADNTGGMALSTSWCFFILDRVAPAHRIRVQHIQVIARYDLLEGFTATIVASK